jgi:hypothetical protein
MAAIDGLRVRHLGMLQAAQRAHAPPLAAHAGAGPRGREGGAGARLSLPGADVNKTGTRAHTPGCSCDRHGCGFLPTYLQYTPAHIRRHHSVIIVRVAMCHCAYMGTERASRSPVEHTGTVYSGNDKTGIYSTLYIQNMHSLHYIQAQSITPLSSAVSLPHGVV